MSYAILKTEQKLSRRLASNIPNATLSAQSLPLVPEIKLLLINQDYPQQLLSSEQIQQIMNYPAYWSFCWGSGQALARHILDQPELVAGKRVLDFGCGSGVAAIAAAMAGASQVTACDIDGDAILASQINAALNDVELIYSPDFFADQQVYELILVADVLYDRANLPLLDAILARAKGVLLADSRVKDFQVQGYRHIGRLRATTVPDLAECEAFSHINLYWGESP